IRENAERLRLLVENAFDILAILTKDGLISYESESVKRILGYTTGERIGSNVFNDPIVHPDDRATKNEAFKKAVSNPQEIVRTEFRQKHKDGSYRDMEAVYVNLLDNPRINGIIATYHEINERRKLEKQREEFVSIASHELKTPVTSMKGYIQILQEMFSSTADSMAIELFQ